MSPRHAAALLVAMAWPAACQSTPAPSHHDGSAGAPPDADADAADADADAQTDQDAGDSPVPGGYSLPGFEGLAYDYLAPVPVRGAAIARLRERATSLAPAEGAGDAQIDERVVRALTAHRDGTPLTIFE